MTATTIVSICCVIIAFVVLAQMQEYEFHRAFIKQKEASASPYALGSAGMGGYGGYVGSTKSNSSSFGGAYMLGNAGVGVGVAAAVGMGGGEGPMPVFIEDTIITLKAMEAAIAQQEDLLGREDLLMECQYKLLRTPHTYANSASGGDSSGDDDAEGDDGRQQGGGGGGGGANAGSAQQELLLAPQSASSSVNKKEHEVVSWKLTSHAASLQINKLLCQSLYYAVANTEGKNGWSAATSSF